MLFTFAALSLDALVFLYIVNLEPAVPSFALYFWLPEIDVLHSQTYTTFQSTIRASAFQVVHRGRLLLAILTERECGVHVTDQAVAPLQHWYPGLQAYTLPLELAL